MTLGGNLLPVSQETCGRWRWQCIDCGEREDGFTFPAEAAEAFEAHWQFCEAGA